MAANNYFGFTHNGTQYSALPATAYAAPAQTSYVQQAPTAYVAAPRTAPTFEAAYQTSHATQQYAYNTRTQVVAPVVQATPAYDTTKTYYTSIANVNPGATVYTLPTETAYQTNKFQPLYDSSKKYYPVAPVAPPPAAVPTTMYTMTAEGSYQMLAVPTTKTIYVPPCYGTQAPARQITAVKIHTTLPASIPSYTFQQNSQMSVIPTVTVTVTSTSNKTPVFNYTGNIDTGMYSGSTSYQHPKVQTSTSLATSGVSSSVNTISTAYQNRRPYSFQHRPRIPPKTPQLHYCDVCKISCAGPQTYREHLEGQKHKKKEASIKTTSAQSSSSSTNSVRGGLVQLHCKLCDIACTGADTYAAHIRGAKHQKVLKLHTSLGKPIPVTDQSANKSLMSSSSSEVDKSKSGSITSKSTTSHGERSKFSKAEDEVDTDDVDSLIRAEKDIQPVGQEYIDEARNETGTAVSFYCKLCDCKFTDPNAKIMHMKGRRHRLQYKKKVDPSLQVDIKPAYNRRGCHGDDHHQFSHPGGGGGGGGGFRRRQFEDKWRMEWEQRRYEEEMMEYHRQNNPPPFGIHMGPMVMRRPALDSYNDRHVMAKHVSIYPKEEELEAVQVTVSSIEKVLKSVSDQLTKSRKEGTKEDTKDCNKEEEEKEEDNVEENRVLKGVMRVGPLSKGLILHNNLNVHLVALCTDKPTRALLDDVIERVKKELEETEFDVELCLNEVGFLIKRSTEPKTTCIVSLTSPIIREEMMVKTEAVFGTDILDLLNRQKCLEALASLRHAKWFQAKASPLQSCVIIIRIMKDFCQRFPLWATLKAWPIELLVEKCLSSANNPLSPGDALRRVFECISSGILLPGSPGIHDPCEKDATDAFADVSVQDKEDITSSAQQMLRLIAFQQIHNVLGMNRLPSGNGSNASVAPRKRLRSASSDSNIQCEGDEKKVRKEEVSSVLG